MTTPERRDPGASSRAGSRSLAALALVIASALVPFGVGALLGPLAHDVPLEPRVAGVFAAASVIAIGAWVTAQEAKGARRWLPALCLVAPLAHLVWPRSSVAAALDALTYLFFSFGTATSILRRVIVAPERPRAARAALAVVFVALVHAPLALVALGLVSCVALPAIVRLLHPTPLLEGDERAVEITTDDGLTLRATHWPGRAGAPAIVIAHGRGDGRDRMLEWARELHDRGAHVLAYDSRAHAASDGVVVTFADREPGDVVRVVERLEALSGASPSSIAVMGESMGGGAVLGALPALDRRGVRRAVLLAPASDYGVLVGGYLPPWPLRSPSHAIVAAVSWAMGMASPIDQIPREALAGAPHVAILVLHPRADRTVPLALSERLAREHAGLTLRILEQGGHFGLQRRVREDRAEHDAILTALGLDRGLDPADLDPAGTD